MSASQVDPRRSGSLGIGARLARYELLLWLGALLALRAALLASLGDVFFYGEEFAKGAAAKAMLDGLPTEHWRLAYHAYEGGGFVASHLNALAFLALGESLLALKLVALGFCVLVTALGWLFVERVAGRAAARAFALLVLCLPPSLARLTLLDLGIHFQALVFTLALFVLALDLAAPRGNRRPRLAALGFVAGFGFFFSYQVALSIAAVALVLLVHARPVFAQRASWIALVAGGLAGLAPLLAMGWCAGAAVFDIHGAEAVGASSELDRWAGFEAFLGSIFGERSAWDRAALGALPLCAVLGFVALVRGGPERRAAAWLCAALGVLFAASWFATSFGVGEVYHVFRLNRVWPAWLAAALCAACALGARGPALRRLGGALILFLAVDGLIGLARDVERAGFDPRRAWRELTAHKGYDYSDYLEKLTTHLEGGVARRLEVLTAFDEPARELVAPAAAAAVFRDPRAPLDEIVATCLQVGGERDGRWLMIGLGAWLRQAWGGTMLTRLERLAELPQDWRAPLAEAIGRSGDGLLSSEERWTRELASLRGAELPAPFWRGFGWRLYLVRGDFGPAAPRYFEPVPRALCFDPERAASFFSLEPEAIQRELTAGYTAARAAHRHP